MNSVVIIGAGAAGCFAGIAAAQQGKHVIIIEKNEKIGKKLYITGKGRCNITNMCAPREFTNSVVSNPKFLMSAINAFPPEATVDFFEEAGCPIKIERGNRAFPASDKSSDIINVLKNKLQGLGVRVVYGETVKSISKSLEDFAVTTDKNVYTASGVIIATGGMSYPLTGSTGDGFAFAKQFGHTVKEPKPALCPILLSGALNTEGRLIASGNLHFPEGLSLKNITVSAIRGEKIICSEFGEMLFTEDGVSGPIILTISSLINRLPLGELKLVLDLKPSLDEEMLDARILRDFSEVCNKQFRNSLDDLLPKSMIPYIVALSGIAPEKRINIVTKFERQELVKLIKHLVFPVKSLGSQEEAIVTAGGVNVAEVNPKTMESKLVKGLFFAGEVMDVDAFTGGFNLQIAIATGYAAGCHA